MCTSGFKMMVADYLLDESVLVFKSVGGGVFF